MILWYKSRRDLTDCFTQKIKRVIELLETQVYIVKSHPLSGLGTPFIPEVRIHILPAYASQQHLFSSYLSSLRVEAVFHGSEG